MKIHSVFTIICMITLALNATVACAQISNDTMAVQQIIDSEVAAWNAKDAQAYGSHFAPQGTFTNVLGMFFIGREAFTQKHAGVFKSIFRGTRLTNSTVSMKFLDADVVIVETLTTLSGFSPDGPAPGTALDGSGHLHTRLLQVLKRHGKEWQIEAYHNVDVKTGIPVKEN